MRIDIDILTETELVELNNRIVARLRFLHDMRAHSKMLEFNLGDRVVFQPDGRLVFQPDGRPLLLGTLIRYNKKSVTVITEGGERWNVAPGLLRKLGSAQTEQEEDLAAILHFEPE